MTRRRQGGRRARGASGLTLVELLLVLTAGLVLGTALVQVLLAESRSATWLAARLRAAGEQRRALELIREDLQRADGFRIAAGAGAGCGLAGRRVVLHLPGGVPVTYSIGAPPSPIWRGEVLMRCGPAFGLDGEPSAGALQNRVLLDGLPSDGAQVKDLLDGRLELGLRQVVALRMGQELTLSSRLVVATP